VCFSDDDHAERSLSFWQVCVESAEPGDVPRVVTREHLAREAVTAALRGLNFDPTGCKWVRAGEPDL
jgi:hypothetical protein